MTFSIVARSTDGQSWGVAVASKFLAVGSAVPAAVAGYRRNRHPGRHRGRRRRGGPTPAQSAPWPLRRPVAAAVT